MEFEIIEADSLINGKYDKVLYDKFIEAYEVDDYEVPKKYLEEKNDNLGRKIIFNKYKILELLYNEFLNK